MTGSVSDLSLRIAIKYLAAPALFIATGNLIVSAARDLFEIDPIQRPIPSLIGRPPRLVTEFKLMSDAAQDGRLEVEQIASLLRVAVYTLLFFSVAYFVIEGLLSFTYYFFLDNDSKLLNTATEYLTNETLYSVLAVGGGFGSLLVYRIASMLFHITEAKINYHANK